MWEWCHSLATNKGIFSGQLQFWYRTLKKKKKSKDINKKDMRSKLFSSSPFKRQFLLDERAVILLSILGMKVYPQPRKGWGISGKLGPYVLRTYLAFIVRWTQLWCSCYRLGERSQVPQRQHRVVSGSWDGQYYREQWIPYHFKELLWIGSYHWWAHISDI